MSFRAVAAAMLLATSYFQHIGLAAAADDGQERPFVEQGTASWYGPGFEGKPTASGEKYDQDDLTAAHKELPLGVTATVKNLENGKGVEVRINDRGPFVNGRIIDLSKAAAEKLDMDEKGMVEARIEVSKKELDRAEQAKQDKAGKDEEDKMSEEDRTGKEPPHEVAGATPARPVAKPGTIAE